MAAVLQALFRDHRQALARDLGEALDLATLALALADRLDAGWRGPDRLADLRTAALVRAANANRLAGRHREAARLLGRAARTQPQGTGEPLLEAELLTVAGSLWQALRRFERAAQAFGHAEQVYREIGETHLAARSLVARAEAIGHHHPRHGIRLIRRALGEIDGALDPQLELAAHHNLAWYLNDAGHCREARTEVERSAALYHRGGGNVVATLARAWLRGRIERSLDEFDRARRSYGLAQAGFKELRMHLHLTMLAIDRAELRVAEGDPASAAALLATTLAQVEMGRHPRNPHHPRHPAPVGPHPQLPARQLPPGLARRPPPLGESRRRGRAGLRRQIAAGQAAPAVGK